VSGFATRPTEDPPLDEREALTMAYIDDELEPKERRRFEVMLADDPDLAAEVAELRTLMDLSRSTALMEPTDHEMRRFWARFYNRTEWRVGWFLLVLGCTVLFVCGLVELMLWPSLHWIVKAAIVCALVGGGLLLWSNVRLKLRSIRFDRYRGVMR